MLVILWLIFGKNWSKTSEGNQNNLKIRNWCENQKESKKNLGTLTGMILSDLFFWTLRELFCRIPKIKKAGNQTQERLPKPRILTEKPLRNPKMSFLAQNNEGFSF